jgi:RES domain-containing protein
LRVWRLCAAEHARFDGEGARLAGGRWNRRGTAMVYTSATLSLAALEYLVHVSWETAPKNLMACGAEIPDDLARIAIDVRDLPSGWRSYPAPEALAEIGEKWIREKKVAVLVVPSAVVPEESNVLLDPAHPDFERIRVLDSKPFSFDPRFRSRR